MCMLIESSRLKASFVAAVSSSVFLKQRLFNAEQQRRSLETASFSVAKFLLLSVAQRSPRPAFAYPGKERRPSHCL